MQEQAWFMEQLGIRVQGSGISSQGSVLVMRVYGLGMRV